MSQKRAASESAEIAALRQEAAEFKKRILELEGRQLMYEQLLDSTTDIIIVKDRNSTIVYANKALRDFYGMSKSEIEGIKDAPFNDPEITARYLADDAYVMETGNTLVIKEEPATRHDGKLHVVETIKSPIRDAQGNVTMMVAVCRDITERTLLEEDRRRAEQALDDTERLFRQMAESMRDVFWVAAPDASTIFYVSPSYENMWGRPCRELLSNPKSFWDAILPADRAQFGRKLEASIQAGDGSFNHEFRIARGDEIRWLWARTFPIYDGGKLVRVCGITHDITERKEVERRVSEFNSMVSHELRTPLTSIRAALGLIAGGQAEPIGVETRDLLNIAIVECDRMIRLINDLLDIKKIEADKLDLHMQDLHPIEIVDAVTSANRSAAAACNVSLIADVQVNQAFRGDRDRIIQVLANLISNAFKFSPPQGKVELVVELTDAGKVRFSVSDEGPGIPESEREKLFLAFQQIDSSDSRAKGGTGLGLAISKAIVARHSGTIGFKTGEKTGSTFWFELPCGGSERNKKRRGKPQASKFE